MLLIATERGLESAIFTNDDPSPYFKLVDRDGAEEAFMAPYVEQLTEYFAGTRREFTFPLDLKGTDFQIACWYALKNIPYGQTRTYAQIADLIGRPKGARAVGTANHANPLAVVIPCHRVVASVGLGGYGFGLPAKRFLLRLEGCKI